MKHVDDQIFKLLTAFKSTPYYANTIISYTSDHGEMLGAHGQHQKYYNAYEETTHVPLIFSTPTMRKNNTGTKYITNLTSAVDLLPTLLGLMDVDRITAYNNVYKQFYREKHRLYGNNLAGLIDSTKQIEIVSKNAFYQTQDDIFNGTANYPVYLSDSAAVGSFALLPMTSYTVKSRLLQIARFLFGEYNAPSAPRNIDAVITMIGNAKYKFVHYFDDPENWSRPFVWNQFTYNQGLLRGYSTIQTTPVNPEYEIYNLTDDPTEMKNLAYKNTNSDLFKQLNTVLEAERKTRVLYFHDSSYIFSNINMTFFEQSAFRSANIMALVRNIVLLPFTIINYIVIYIFQWIFYLGGAGVISYWYGL